MEEDSSALPPPDAVVEREAAKEEEEVKGAKWLRIKKPIPVRPVMTSEELITFASKVNAELLAEVEALPGQFNLAHDQTYDVMNRAGHYNVKTDAILSGAFGIVGREVARQNADKGPSISKERFSTRYWDTWNKDYILLEDLSRQELEAERERQRLLGARKPKPPPNPKLKRVTPLERSHLKGNTFGLPKETRPAYFDYHQLGNRNAPFARCPAKNVTIRDMSSGATCPAVRGACTWPT